MGTAVELIQNNSVIQSLNLCTKSIVNNTLTRTKKFTRHCGCQIVVENKAVLWWQSGVTLSDTNDMSNS